jgi:hypothetical protein
LAPQRGNAGYDFDGLPAQGLKNYSNQVALTVIVSAQRVNGLRQMPMRMIASPTIIRFGFLSAFLRLVWRLNAATGRSP